MANNSGYYSHLLSNPNLSKDEKHELHTLMVRDRLLADMQRKEEEARMKAELEAQLGMNVGVRPDYSADVAATRGPDVSNSRQVRVTADRSPLKKWINDYKTDTIVEDNPTHNSKECLKRVHVVIGGKASQLNERDPCKATPDGVLEWTRDHEQSEDMERESPWKCNYHAEEDVCFFKPGQGVLIEKKESILKVIKNDSKFTIGVFRVDSEVGTPQSVTPLYKNRVDAIEQAFKNHFEGDVKDVDGFFGLSNITLVAILESSETKTFGEHIFYLDPPTSFLRAADGSNNTAFVQEAMSKRALTYDLPVAKLEEMVKEALENDYDQSVSANTPLGQFLMNMDREIVGLEMTALATSDATHIPIQADDLKEIPDKYRAYMSNLYLRLNRPYREQWFVVRLDGESWVDNEDEADENVEISIECEEFYNFCRLPTLMDSGVVQRDLPPPEIY